MKSIWENTREDTYEYFAGIKDCYDSLVDDLSRKVFLARMAFDLGEWDGYIDLIRCSGLMTEDEIIKNYAWVDKFAQTQKPVYIYGAGQFGGHTCRMLQQKHVSIVGFFDQNYKNINTRCGLPVLEPPTCSFDKQASIFITPSLPVEEIYQKLMEQGVYSDCFLNVDNPRLDLEHQYFDFPSYYTPKGVFVDAGCFDFDTSVRFVRWAQGKYEKILALEPDKANLKICKDNAAKYKIDRVEFLQAGLWSSTQEGRFGALGNTCSRVVDEGGETIQLVALDDVIGKQKLSFLKMDIEGVELKALEGAADVIRRDKPLCALSVYHNPGDQLVLMKYLKQLVPEYQFALRHYSTMAVETILYVF